jgi:hypothetical protein
MLLSWAFAVHAMIPAKRRVPIFLSVFFIIIGVFSAKLVKTNGFSSFLCSRSLRFGILLGRALSSLLLCCLKIGGASEKPQLTQEREQK